VGGIYRMSNLTKPFGKLRQPHQCRLIAMLSYPDLRTALGGSMASDAGSDEGSVTTTATLKGQPLTPDYFKSILAAGPTLEHLAKARIAMDAEDPETRKLAAKYWPLLWKRYKKRRPIRHRRIVRCFFGQHAAWGIILFSDGMLDYDYPVEIASLVSAEWGGLVSETSATINEIAMAVRGRQKRVISARLFGLLHTLFLAIEGSAATDDHLDETLKNVQANVEETTRNIRDHALQADSRVAQQQYLIGMFLGLIIVAAMIFATRWLLPLGVTIKYLRVVLGGGALGALLSVLVRTTSAQFSSSLQVDTQAGRPLIVSAGAFRPIVGALLALAVYVLIEGGLIPIKIPSDYHDLWFVSGISFLAGFTERFAQDALVNTSRATFGSGGTTERSAQDALVNRSHATFGSASTKEPPDSPS
jgi:hypothetical protein